MNKSLIVLVLAGLSVHAWAINMSGFREAPITRLSESELKTFRAAVMQVLDQAPDGEHEWRLVTREPVEREAVEVEPVVDARQPFRPSDGRQVATVVVAHRDCETGAAHLACE